MPLTTFQKEVLRVIARNRTPESHLAGGAAINRSETGLRFSDDLDIFHDIEASVAASAEKDAETLRGAGFVVEWAVRSASFVQANVRRAEESVRIDWAADSAFRFFPVQPDEEVGYCLHRADLATNKILALATRTVIRDFLDALTLDQTYLSLGSLVWAACGKDPGWTPALLLDLASRHSRFQEDDLRQVSLTRPVDLKELKLQWLASKERAERLIDRLPEIEIGCLYLDADNNPVTPDPGSPTFPSLTRHFGSVRGAWPSVSS